MYVHTATCYSNYQGDTWPCLPHSTMLPSYPFYAPTPPLPPLSLYIVMTLSQLCTTKSIN